MLVAQRIVRGDVAQLPVGNIQALGTRAHGVLQGPHLAAHDVKVTSGTRVEAEPLHPWASVLLDVDGEQPGRLPVKATMLKGALTFRA